MSNWGKNSSEIHWDLLDEHNVKTGKSSGMNIEYSISDEIEFAQKLSILIRKQAMRELIAYETQQQHQELNEIGRLFSRDYVLEELGNCTKENVRKPKYPDNINYKSSVGTLFKVYDFKKYTTRK